MGEWVVLERRWPPNEVPKSQSGRARTTIELQHVQTNAILCTPQTGDGQSSRAQGHLAVGGQTRERARPARVHHITQQQTRHAAICTMTGRACCSANYPIIRRPGEWATGIGSPVMLCWGPANLSGRTLFALRSSAPVLANYSQEGHWPMGLRNV